MLGAGHGTRGHADRLCGNPDREPPGGDVGDDVRFDADDRLPAHPAAGVDDRAEADLRAILEHDRREAVLEPLQDRVPMLCVTIIARIVTNTSRPITTGPAHVDECLLAEEREVPDDERRPGVPAAAAADRTLAPG